MRSKGIFIMLLVLGACGQERQPEQTANEQVPSPTPAPNTPLPPASSNAPEPAANSSLPAPATSLPEPKGPIDPKSVEAAGQVVQQYGALIEQKRWAEAANLWEDRSAGDKFAAGIKANRENHLEIGELSRPGGAAGSTYVSQFVTLYGKDSDGKDFRSKRTVVLRRVNDVPGSTERQRRWHIENFETGWKNL